MNLDNIIKLANMAREKEDWMLSRALSKIAMDVALVESNQYISKQYKIAMWEATNIKKELSNLQMNKLSEEIDIIAKDLEARIIQFESSNPLEAVLDSYKLLHKVASKVDEPNPIKEIVSLAESEDLSDEQLIREIERKTLGYTLNDKKNILYILEKDYNILIPLEKIAKFEIEEKKEDGKLIKNPKTDEDKQKNREIIKEILSIEFDKDIEEDKSKWKSSFPSAPSIWSGFAYEAIVPYQQHNQLNYWSLASSNEDKILNKIAKIRK